MKNPLGKTLSCALALALAASALAGCGARQAQSADLPEGAVSIALSDAGITVDGAAVTEDETAAVYTAHDIVYYQDGQDISYGAGSESDAHTAEEADAHTVVHITQPGTYALSGKLSAGQIAVDLGEDAKTDPSAVVTLYLNGVDITCTVAPAVIFYRVYECDTAWVDYDENGTEGYEATYAVDTSAAGANVIIADGTENTVSGSYVAKIYKPESVTLSEDGTEVTDAKKLHKYDGAFYSRMSMNVSGGAAGDGILTILAENEGLDSELHLTVNGGDIRITSGDDGINTNEDGVSVTTINGGKLTVTATGSLAGEGDGIDSNGWLVVNGGTVIAAACPTSADSGLDSDMGIYLNGGTVAASGSMLDEIAEGSAQTYAAFSFAEKQPGGETYTLKDTSGAAVLSCAPVNAFSQLLLSSPDLAGGTYTFWQGETQLAGAEGGGMGGGMPGGQQPPEGEAPQVPADGETPPEPPEGGNTPADGQEPPEMPDGQQPPEGDPGENGGTPPQRPDGSGQAPQAPADGETPPEPPEGGNTPADGQEPPEMPGGFTPGGAGSAETSTEFTVTDGGNHFSQVGPAGNGTDTQE